VLALDVDAGADTRSIVAFGDSLTDGWVASGPTTVDVTYSNTNARYPDVLQRRIAARGLPLSVINAGLSSNQVLKSIFPIAGPSALERFTADVPYFASARGVIVFEGINDLGLSKASATSLIDGLGKLVAEAHAANLKVWLATITPASNSQLHGVKAAPNSERDRQTINQWIRTQRVADGYFDFDQAVRDPANPAVLGAPYGGVDNLHLSPAGYARLAETVDLSALGATTC
jgi:lysophospholipase L1-like esterase